MSPKHPLHADYRRDTRHRHAQNGRPPLYTPWLHDLLSGVLPAEESKATCDNCVMCQAGETTSPGVFFDPSVRCCTYQPAIPNYLVGRILRDRDPALAAGRATVERRIEARMAVTPWGLDQSRGFRLLYDNGRAHFGRAPGLRCPHYIDSEAGTCGIWRHRPGVCATWFCKHERGKIGFEFWKQLAHLLREMERELGLWCVLELGAASTPVIQWESSGPLPPTFAREYRRGCPPERRRRDGGPILPDLKNGFVHPAGLDLKHPGTLGLPPLDRRGP